MNTPEDVEKRRLPSLSETSFHKPEMLDPYLHLSLREVSMISVFLACSQGFSTK